jgi:aspartyl-tRNA(Asn)/glutamyl-tRNA(Gln) amidotransferase subunit C
MKPIGLSGWKRSSDGNAAFQQFAIGVCECASPHPLFSLFPFPAGPPPLTLRPMAAIHIDVKDVARLARLRLTPEEEEKFGAQLSQVLGYIEKLKELDVSQVEPTAHAVPMVNVTRPDEVRPSLPTEEALRNAPARANGLFVVPKIVE